MTAPGVSSGRGAWTKVGKDNGRRYYQLVPGTPMDGASSTRDVNYEAVHYAVRAVQTRVKSYGYPSTLNPSGRFDQATKSGVVWFQTKTGLVPDGIVGPATAKKLWRDLVAYIGTAHTGHPEHIWGMMHLESAFDPGAVGYLTPSDRGLCQINLVAHPAISVAQAFDPIFAIDYSAKRYRDARAQFAGKGPDLQTKCAILQHNSPLAARTLYEVGSIGDDEKGAIYIALVLQHAEGFPR